MTLMPPLGQRRSLPPRKRRAGNPGAPITLDIHFDETDSRCRTETKFNGVVDAVFFRVVITNNTGMLQRSCRGFGREVQRENGSSAIRDNVQLTWATFSYPLPTMLDLTSGEEHNLDVFFIAADGTIGFATPNFVRPGSFPHDFFSAHGLYTFSVTVASNNSPARTVRLILDWRGDWRNARVRAAPGVFGYDVEKTNVATTTVEAWEKRQRERIAEAESILDKLPVTEQTRQISRIRGLKAALKKGPDRISEIARKAAATRQANTSRP
jgi:hypothetical protein